MVSEAEEPAGRCRAAPPSDSHRSAGRLWNPGVSSSSLFSSASLFFSHGRGRREEPKLESAIKAAAASELAAREHGESPPPPPSASLQAWVAARVSARRTETAHEFRDEFRKCLWFPSGSIQIPVETSYRREGFLESRGTWRQVALVRQLARFRRVEQTTFRLVETALQRGCAKGFLAVQVACMLCDIRPTMGSERNGRVARASRAFWSDLRVQRNVMDLTCWARGTLVSGAQISQNRAPQFEVPSRFNILRRLRLAQPWGSLSASPAAFHPR